MMRNVTIRTVAHRDGSPPPFCEWCGNPRHVGDHGVVVERKGDLRNIDCIIMAFEHDVVHVDLQARR